MSADVNILKQGRFKLLKRLGEGGGGEVYEALDCESQATVAIKKLRRFSPEGLQMSPNKMIQAWALKITLKPKRISSPPLAWKT